MGPGYRQLPVTRGRRQIGYRIRRLRLRGRGGEQGESAEQQREGGEEEGAETPAARLRRARRLYGCRGSRWAAGPLGRWAAGPLREYVPETSVSNRVTGRPRATGLGDGTASGAVPHAADDTLLENLVMAHLLPVWPGRGHSPVALVGCAVAANRRLVPDKHTQITLGPYYSSVN